VFAIRFSDGREQASELGNGKKQLEERSGLRWCLQYPGYLLGAKSGKYTAASAELPVVQEVFEI
jgi:hypothetical protein